MGRGRDAARCYVSGIAGPQVVPALPAGLLGAGWHGAGVRAAPAAPHTCGLGAARSLLSRGRSCRQSWAAHPQLCGLCFCSPQASSEFSSSSAAEAEAQQLWRAGTGLALGSALQAAADGSVPEQTQLGSAEGCSPLM